LLWNEVRQPDRRISVRFSSRLVSAAVALATLAPAAAYAQWVYPPPYPYPYSAYRYGYAESDLRIRVKPKDASVYVDGYFAGKVEDFDGVFQRLHVEPGQHEIVVYLEGYRSLRQRLYLSPQSTRTIEGRLEKLAPGEPAEAPPQPVARPDVPNQAPPRQPPFAGRGARRGPPPPPEPPMPPAPPQPPDAGRTSPAQPSASRFGTLSVAVQPSGATVLVDGERWQGPSGPDERLIIQLSQGRHRVEVRRDGYEPFVTDIDVRPSETSPLNVSLARSR
jgi:hypothetical protein